MGLNFYYPAGATPLDADDAAGLIPTHISTQGQLNEWEYANVARGEAWVFGLRRRQILTIDFLQELHRNMFGETWTWAGQIRMKATLPVGAAPEQIRPALLVLLGDVQFQLDRPPWSIEEITARFHHRLVYIHPFPNGNGRFARTMSDLLLHRSGRERFSWGANLAQPGEARQRYIGALQAADHNDYAPLFELLGVGGIGA
ncbi:MAG: mobile mystery protein B [Steroidobacteraceae bacterium]